MATIDAVLGTTELLESILVCLPTSDLLLAQRVSRYWQSVICQSIKLQRALFFEADKGERLTLALEDNDVKKHWVRAGSDRSGKLLKNPLLEPLFEIIEANVTDFSFGAGLPQSWRRQNASWRRMLPAQPAIETSAYVGLWGLPDFWCAYYTEKTMPMFCTADVRIGQLVDQLDEKYGRFPYGRKKIVIVGLDY